MTRQAVAPKTQLPTPVKLTEFPPFVNKPVATRFMTPIYCKRPPRLEPKAIGRYHVFNFFGPSCLLAVISAQGRVFLAYKTENAILLRTNEGESMNKGPVHRFITQHLEALKNGAVPAMLKSTLARLRWHPVGNVFLPTTPSPKNSGFIELKTDGVLGQF